MLLRVGESSRAWVEMPGLLRQLTSLNLAQPSITAALRWQLEALLDKNLLGRFWSGRLYILLGIGATLGLKAEHALEHCDKCRI